MQPTATSAIIGHESADCGNAGSVTAWVARTVAALRGVWTALAFGKRQVFSKKAMKELSKAFSSGDDDGGDEEPPKRKSSDPAAKVIEARTTDEKLDRIADYMRETTGKLDRIEHDIDFLKSQVDRILEKL